MKWDEGVWDEGTWDSPSPTISVSKTINTAKRMKRQRYYPTRIPAQVLWLIQYRGALVKNGAALGLDPTELTAALKDADWLIYVLGTWLGKVRADSVSATLAVEDAQTGTGSAVMVLPDLTAAPLPAGTESVAPGALNRIFALVQDFKNAAGYDDAIGMALGVLGSAAPGLDEATLAPDLTAKILSGQVNLGWSWQGHTADLDLCQIVVERNDGKGEVNVVYDTTPGYIDKTPLPATPTKWTYRAIYRVGEDQIGQWCAPVSILVGG